MVLEFVVYNVVPADFCAPLVHSRYDESASVSCSICYVNRSIEKEQHDTIATSMCIPYNCPDRIRTRPEADEWAAMSTFQHLDIPGRASGSTQI
jgi:hypothetical protein